MTLQKIEAYLTHVCQELRLPGLSVVIVQDSQVIYTHSFGIARPGWGVSPRTPFILGSLSKSFTALAVMQLVEGGMVCLDDPVQRYIPWFTVASSDASLITVRHLLTHTSGLSRYTGRDLLSGRGNKSVEQSVRELVTVKLVHQPGAQYEYSNSNYLVLSCLIEVVSGMSYPFYVDQHIFGPLSMGESAAAPIVPDLAQGYRWWFGFPFPFDAPYLYDAQGAAFLISSASDMARWLLLHLSDGSFDGVRVLSPAGMAALHAPFISTGKDGSMAAMGWRVETLAGERMLRHGGEVSNFRSDMLVIPGRGLGVAVLANCNNGLVAMLGLDQIALQVMRLLLGQPLLQKRISFKRFSLGVAVLALVLTLLQVVLWLVLAFSNGSGPLSIALLASGLLWPLFVLVHVPRLADMPWRGLLLYVPDLSLWLMSLAGTTLFLNSSILFYWVAAGR